MREIEKIKKELKEEMEFILERDKPDERIKKALKELDGPYTPGWLWWHLELAGKRLLEASKLAKELMYAYRNEELPKEITPEDFAMGLLKAVAGINEEVKLRRYHFWQKIFCKKSSRDSTLSEEDSDHSGGMKGCSSCST